MATQSPLSRPAGELRLAVGGEGRWRSPSRELVAAGPLAAGFALHLGTRVDLFSGTACLELLDVPDRGPASHPARVRELFADELGGRPEELFDGFESEPFASLLLSQWHRVRMPGGAAALVELLHPELELESEAAGLRALAGRLVTAGALPRAAEEAVEEFLSGLDRRRASLALDELADDTEAGRWIDVPRPFLRFCSPRIRVISDPGGRSVADLLGEPGERSSLEARARRLGRGWLGLALGGRRFPAQPFGPHLRHLPDGRVAFVGGPVHRLPGIVRTALRDYLAAVAAQRPAAAAAAFFDLLAESTTDRRLRDRLRHTEPFRDRGWDVGGDRFARQVLAHWRSAEALGHRLEESLQPFYRGLFLLNRETGALAPHATPLRDGLRETRLLLLFDEIRDSAENGRWNNALERQLALLGGLPQKLDRILTLAAEEDPGNLAAGSGRRERRAASDRRSEASRGSGVLPAVTACLLAIGAVALVTERLADVAALAPWFEGLGAVTVLLLGAGLLRAIVRE